MLVKLLGGWNFIVVIAKPNTKLSRQVAEQRYNRLVHPWKYLPRRSYILKKTMMPLMNFTGVQVRALELGI